MKRVNIQEAKTHLSRYVDAVSEGDEIIISKHGKPMARLIPYKPAHGKRRLGGLDKKIRMSDDFDAEDPRIHRLFYGK